MAFSGEQELEWSVAGRPYPGETLSGDNHLVARTPKGWLLAVVDGLGHGPQAAAVGNTFVETLASHVGLEVKELLRSCHQSLKNTRGSAGAIAAIDRKSRRLSWLGVGNVEGVIRHRGGEMPVTEYITMRGGIIGYRLPELQSSVLCLRDGDVIALATDGIHSDFVEQLEPGKDPELLAATILEHYAKPTDDALVLVARWCSSPQGGREEP